VQGNEAKANGHTGSHWLTALSHWLTLNCRSRVTDSFSYTRSQTLVVARHRLTWGGGGSSVTYSLLAKYSLLLALGRARLEYHIFLTSLRLD